MKTRPDFSVRSLARTTIVLLLLLSTVACPAWGWGNKEHMQLTRLAAMRLLADPTTPEAMRYWLRTATPGALDMEGERQYFLRARIGMIPRGADGLSYWATMPDMAAMSEQSVKVQPFDVVERNLHFVDVEFFMPNEADRIYRHDLIGKPRLEDFPKDLKDERWARAGMLPFRVEDCYQKLVKAIRENRMTDQPGQFPRDDHAVKWAGFLAHYLEDNTQPQHASVDYQSKSYFADKRQAPNVHSEVEYRMNDDDSDDHMALREEFWKEFIGSLDATSAPDFNDGLTSTDPWKSTIEVSLKSYEALPLIGLAAMKAGKQGGTPEAPVGPAEALDTEVFFQFKGSCFGREMTVLEMKAHQQAWAVARVARMWRQAWDEAHGGAPLITSQSASTQPTNPPRE